jgi:hypothetical protein
MTTSIILGLIGAGFTTASKTVSLVKKEREKTKNKICENDFVEQRHTNRFLKFKNKI